MMEGSLRVSVVIPIHNRRAGLSCALRSVASQTLPPVEVIIVDDASPEPLTLPVEIGADGIPVTIIRNEENIGAGASRNVGAFLAVGDVIAFLDSDDAWHSSYLANVVAAFVEGGPELGVVATSFFWCDDHLRPYRCQRTSDERVDFQDLANRGNYVGGCSVISVRAQAFRRTEGFPAYRGSDDWHFLLASSRVTSIRLLPRPLAFYRSPSATSDPGSSMTHRYRRQILAVAKTLRDFDIQKTQSGLRIRRHTLLMHLARAGRRKMFIRCLVSVVLRDRRISLSYLRYYIEHLLAKTPVKHCQPLITSFRARLYSRRAANILETRTGVRG